jgi:hypothetical protein
LPGTWYVSPHHSDSCSRKALGTATIGRRGINRIPFKNRLRAHGGIACFALNPDSYF